MGKAEILSWVKEAEDNASDTIKGAEEKASSLISEAKVKASEIVLGARSTGQDDARKIVDKARIAASKEAEKVGSDGDEYIASIKSSSESRRNAAVDVVIATFMAD